MTLPITFNQFSNKQKVVLLVCVAVIFLGIGVGLTSLKKAPPPPIQQLPAPTATPTPVPAFFNLMPSSQTLKVGETLTLSLSLNSGAFAVDAVDAILSYDPTVLKALKITPGKLFAQYPIKQIDNKTGKIQLSAAADIKDGKITSFTGEDELSTVTFQALKATDLAQIVWDTNSIVASAGKNILELEESAEGIYTIIPK